MLDDDTVGGRGGGGYRRAAERLLSPTCTDNVTGGRGRGRGRGGGRGGRGGRYALETGYCSIPVSGRARVLWRGDGEGRCDVELAPCPTLVGGCRARVCGRGAGGSGGSM